jgi:hypothetical protein
MIGPRFQGRLNFEDFSCLIFIEKNILKNVNKILNKNTSMFLPVNSMDIPSFAILFANESARQPANAFTKIVNVGTGPVIYRLGSNES